MLQYVFNILTIGYFLIKKIYQFFNTNSSKNNAFVKVSLIIDFTYACLYALAIYFCKL